jgi:hypothetical protein
VGPDEETLVGDLAGLSFKLGERQGRWQFAELAFPILFVRVAAAPRPNSPDWFLFRTDCSGYRAAAPTSRLWDGRHDSPVSLAQRPFGAQGVLPAFSNWSDCLYHPIDRNARSHWPNQHADLAWRPGYDITDFFETLHDLLHDSDYLAASMALEAAFLPGETLEKHSPRVA